MLGVGGAMQKKNGPPESSRKNDGEEDLTTILTATQRADLTLLIASISDSMRQSLLENFDAEISVQSSALLNRAAAVRKGEEENEKELLSLQGQADPVTSIATDVELVEKQRLLKAKYQQDIDSVKTKSLKDDRLKAFDEWRDSVLSRVGEVVNSRTAAAAGQQSRETAVLDHDHNHDDDEMVTPENSTVSQGVIKLGHDGHDSESKLQFSDLYPPTKNALTKLPTERRVLVLHSLLLTLLSLEHYTAPSRVLILLLCSSLQLPVQTLEQDEVTTAKGLLESAKELSAVEETKKKAEENKDSRKWKVGLATVAGAAIIGVSGGLAAPLVAAGVGSILGGLGLGATTAATYLGTVASSTYLIGGLFGAYGGRMTGQMMDNYAREVEDFEFLPVHTNKKTSEDEKQAVKQASEHGHKLKVTICISGWLTEKEDTVNPWRVLGTRAEVFALKYELEALLNLGNAIQGFVTSAAWGYAKKKIIAQTIFADLAAAMWPLGLMKAARVVDNPFNLAKSKSEKAGEVLADALINKAQGERPVTLIGFSLGARVMYSCLLSLARRRAFGIVENAVFIGAPIPSDTSDWRVLRTVVSGRLVNVYSQNDYVLGFMYRTSSLQFGVAGLQAVQGIAHVENVDVSEEVTGHLRYKYLIGSILSQIGFEDINLIAVEEERRALKKMEEEEKRRAAEAQQKSQQRQQSGDGTADEAVDAEREASEIEKDIQARTQKSLATRAMESLYISKPTTPERGANHAPQQDDKADQSWGGYLSKTTGYLPSMPKNMPSVPSWAGGGGHTKSPRESNTNDQS